MNLFPAPAVALLAIVISVRAAGVPPVPSADLPAGLELIVAARPPQVNHPLLGCLDDRGRLFLGDAAGLNLDRAELEKQLPNRILMLEDTKGNGIYDKSTVFADKMTFPQAGCWLNGSLYAASAPGIWKLTDTNGDGVADRREMIVDGFDYVGNSADVHGPFLSPDGRLYWCDGRHGHRVFQKDGTLVHEGLGSGVWSCRPDGSDIRWYSLGCMDNPVTLDFTPEGEPLGVVNLYYKQPRGDTLVHWLYGGVYERADFLNAIAGLPRTLQHLPIVHNFGHVAVAGCTFYRSGALNPAWTGNLLMVEYDNQKVVRLQVAVKGATYEATEHEFIKIHAPGVHLTQAIEDADGSLVILDTGEWFRLSCDSGFMANSGIKGAVYRIRRKDGVTLADPYGRQIPWDTLDAAGRAKLTADPRWWVRQKATRLVREAEPILPVGEEALSPSRPPLERLQACRAIAEAKTIAPPVRARLLAMLAEPLEPALEHQAMYAAIATRTFGAADLDPKASPTLARRLLQVVDQSSDDAATKDSLLAHAQRYFDSSDPELQRTAVAVASRNPRALEQLGADFKSWLDRGQPSAGRLAGIESVVAAQLNAPGAHDLVAFLLGHRSPAARRIAWRILANQSGKVSDPRWVPALRRSLAAAMENEGTAGSGERDNLPLLLDAIGKLETAPFERQLRAVIRDPHRSESIRFKALAAFSQPHQAVDDEAFALLSRMLADPDSPSTRFAASRMLLLARLRPDQLRALVPAFAVADPIELGQLLLIVPRADEETTREIALSLARSPILPSIEENTVLTAFVSFPPQKYEAILGPIMRSAAAVRERKKRELETLAGQVGQGRPNEGRRLFASGKIACIACHQIGSVGRSIGPDLSRIGQIRGPRDILESIIFPSATIVRDYELHVVETSDGQSYTGLAKNVSVEGIKLTDMTGEEKFIPRERIVADTLSPTSLMPVGLDDTMTRPQLLDLVAWLVSLK